MAWGLDGAWEMGKPELARKARNNLWNIVEKSGHMNSAHPPFHRLVGIGSTPIFTVINGCQCSLEKHTSPDLPRGSQEIKTSYSTHAFSLKWALSGSQESFTVQPQGRNGGTHLRNVFVGQQEPRDWWRFIFIWALSLLHLTSQRVMLIFKIFLDHSNRDSKQKWKQMLMSEPQLQMISPWQGHFKKPTN